MTRADQKEAFLHEHGWESAQRIRITPDASNRRYERLVHGQKGRAILMDAVPDAGEDVRAFVRIAHHLQACNLSSPRIWASQLDQGFLLLEDLGDDLFARLVARRPTYERPVYRAAVDVLVHLHRASPVNLPAYDGQTMCDLALLAFDWYQAAAGVSAGDGRAQAQRHLLGLLGPLVPSVLVHRDYHAENLIWLPSRAGPGRVGLLDFQDAMLGHPAYDLCSILMDARHDVPRILQDEMREYYVQSAGITDKPAFERAYMALALQRNLRILGVFTRLCVRDGKAHYVDLIPRVWGYIERALLMPEHAQIREVLLRALPAPTDEICNRIKAQCSSHPTL